MAETIDAAALANLLDDLLAWLKENPNGDLDDFAEEHDCSIEDISDSWNTFFSGDFSRKYDIDTDYHPSTPPHGDPQALKSYIVKEVSTYQQFTTINNIEDNSFNQQIFAKGDVNQDIDIDNSDNIADDGGVVIRDSELDDSNVVTGDRNVVDSDGTNAITGDVSTSADDDSNAATNINFGDGDVKNAQVDVTNTGDNTTGSADGGDGGRANADSDADGGAGGAGGDGGNGGDLDDPFLGVGGDAGDGGAGGAGGSAASSADADADGGDGGFSGDAGNDTDITIVQ